MREEQRMILRMLEEGRINAGEAEALLKALVDGAQSPESEMQEDPWVRVEKMGEDFASKVEIATERFARSLEHGVSDKLSKLPKILARFPLFGYEESHEFTNHIRGKLSLADVFPVDLRNANGPIRVEGWSEPGYQLTIVQKLRGNDRELLKGQLFSVDWQDGEERRDLRLKIPNSTDASVSLHLKIPEDRKYEVKLLSQNGTLRVENLAIEELNVDTVNGSILLESIKGSVIRGSAGNGACEMWEVQAQTIRHSLGNGSYRASVSASDLELLTTNGSVKVDLLDVAGAANHRLRTTNGMIKVTIPPQTDLGLTLDLKTLVGRVYTDIESLEITKQDRRGGGSALVARSQSHAEKTDRLDLNATCTSGSIDISTKII